MVHEDVLKELEYQKDVARRMRDRAMKEYDLRIAAEAERDMWEDRAYEANQSAHDNIRDRQLTEEELRVAKEGFLTTLFSADQCLEARDTLSARVILRQAINSFKE